MRQILELLSDNIPFIHDNSLVIGVFLMCLILLLCITVIKMD